jgi:hypothetical protein
MCSRCGLQIAFCKGATKGCMLLRQCLHFLQNLARIGLDHTHPKSNTAVAVSGAVVPEGRSSILFSCCIDALMSSQRYTRLWHSQSP